MVLPPSQERSVKWLDLARSARPGPTLILALIVATVFIWPVAWGLEFAWGDPLGETDNHMWMFWSAVHQGGLAVSNAPEGNPIPLMDPIHLPVYWLGQVMGGPTLGWRFLVFFNVGLALLGGYGLAGELAGPRGAWVGMVATGCAPVLGGLLNFGITESWTLGWLSIHAWMLIAFARRGGLARGALAGFSLGAIALSGWYHAVYGLILEATLLPLLLWRWKRPGLLLQGLIGLVMAWPAWIRFQDARSIWEARWRMPPPGPPGPREDWADLPVFGTDLVNLVLPRIDTVSPSKCAYLGLVMLGLIGLGLIKDRARTLLMVGLAMPFLLLALGPWPTVGGQAVGFPGPALGLVKVFPQLAGMTHWERAMGAAVPFLAVAAALGAASLPARRGLQVFLCGLLLLDSVVFSSAPWPRSSYSVQAPSGLADLEGDGGLIQIPFDNYRVEHSTDPARIYTRWQLDHQRPISDNYEGKDAALAESELLQVTDGLCRDLSQDEWDRPENDPQTIPPGYKVPFNVRAKDAPEGASLQAELEQLRGWGYQWILLHEDRCPRLKPVTLLLSDRLGPASRVSSEILAWEI